jgi:hypothetical protein
MRGYPGNGRGLCDVAHASSNVTAQGTEGRSRGEVALGNWGDYCGPSANASRALGGDASGLREDDFSSDKTDEKNLPLLGRDNGGPSANASRTSGGDASGLQDDDSSGDKTDEKNLPLPGRCGNCGS